MTLADSVHQQSVDQRARKIVADRLDVAPDQVVPGASLIDDLGADSLDYIQLAMALEEEFGVVIDDTELEEARTYGDLLNILVRLTPALAA